MCMVIFEQNPSPDKKIGSGSDSFRSQFAVYHLLPKRMQHILIVPQVPSGFFLTYEFAQERQMRYNKSDRLTFSRSPYASARWRTLQKGTSFNANQRQNVPLNKAHHSCTSKFQSVVKTIEQIYSCEKNTFHIHQAAIWGE